MLLINILPCLYVLCSARKSIVIHMGDYPKFCVTAKSGANRVKFIMGGRRVIDCRLVYNITPVGRDVKTKPFISPLPSI